MLVATLPNCLRFPHFYSQSILLLCLGALGCGSHSVVPASTLLPSASASSCKVPAITLTHAAGTGQASTIVFLNPATYPQAVCNDGSPAAYVLRPGATGNRWVFSLEGGGQCIDSPSCAIRAVGTPQLVSSTPYRTGASTIPQMSGVEDASATANPDFYDATQVLALYCSSDWWSGGKAADSGYNPNDATTWNFQGRAIIAAILADLTAHHGLSSATEFLLTGGSAGGVGALVNVSDVARTLPVAVRFTASSDAGFADLAGSYDPQGAPPDYATATNPQAATSTSAALALWSAHGESRCAAAASTTAQQLQCFEASNLLAPGGTVVEPMLVTQAQRDPVQMEGAGFPLQAIGSSATSAAEAGYANYFAVTMRAELVATNPYVSLFSPDAFLHEEQNDPALFNASVAFQEANLSLQEAMHAWYQAPCTAQRNVAP